MSSLIGKFTGGFTKLVKGRESQSPKAASSVISEVSKAATSPKAHKTNAQGTSILRREDSENTLVLKEFIASGSDMRQFTLPQQEKISKAFVGKTLEEFQEIGYILKHATPEETKATVEKMLYRARTYESLCKFLGRESLRDEEWLPLVEAGWMFFLGDKLDAYYPISSKAMEKLVSFLKTTPDIDQLNFSEIPETVLFKHLDILIKAKLNRELPNITLLIFQQHQIQGQEQTFNDLQLIGSIKEAADPRGSDVCIIIPGHGEVDINNIT